jgi:hypothetical protein
MRPVSKFAELNGPSMVEFPAVRLDVHDPHRGLKVEKHRFFAFSPSLPLNVNEILNFFFKSHVFFEIPFQRRIGRPAAMSIP